MKLPLYALLAFLGGVSFGILSTFVKIAYGHGFEPGQVIGVQFFVGTVMFWLIYLFRKKESIQTSMIVKLIASGIPMALSGLFYYKSLEYLDASIAIIMLFQFSWMGLFAEWLLDRRLPTVEKWISAVILFVGSLLVADVLGASLDGLSATGVFWGLLAAVSFTAFINVSGRVGITVPAITKSMLMATGSLLTAWLVFPPVFLTDGSFFGDGLVYYGLMLGFFGVVLPPLLFSIAMPKVGSGLGTILSSSELPTAVFMSMVVLGEHVAALQWIGVLVVLFGISLPNFKYIRFNKKRKASN